MAIAEQSEALGAGQRGTLSLALGDGCTVGLTGVGADAERFVQQVATAMCLHPRDQADRTVLVRCGEGGAEARPGIVSCVLDSRWTEEPATALVQIALAIARDAETRGGMLLHGALAARGNAGVILAGPSGIGKTTASNRLVPPWVSLSDDSTLVVRDRKGDFWAHPWPTWSRFYAGGPGGTWNVARCVRLRAVCFLERAPRSRFGRVGGAEAAALAFDSLRPISSSSTAHDSPAAIREYHLRRFDRASTLARTIACFALGLTKDGALCGLLDEILDGCAPT